ncbi:MAG: hypothetical protein ACK5JS_06535 [Mangrovibacterium sp.]
MTYTSSFFKKILLLCICTLGACSDNFISSVPDSSFEFQINLNVYNDLLVPGEAEYFSAGGYSGVWVVNSPILSDKNNPYIAFDACCPYEAKRSIRISDGGGYAQCDSCHTLYNWQVDGSTIAGDSLGGPGTEPLRPYTVSKTGSMLTVFN